MDALHGAVTTALISSWHGVSALIAALSFFIEVGDNQVLVGGQTEIPFMRLFSINSIRCDWLSIPLSEAISAFGENMKSG
ncbi:MAG: hypothetical protein GPOALKHO_001314 [Sodalis sp.]|nr:MAG: hypothetical protein GPOALKHO_001314 [Sodalis sp.]